MASYKPLILKDISLILPHKICFENFNASIPYGSKIAVMGNNGTGKSTLLKSIYGIDTPLEGEINIPDDNIVAYVPQIIENYDNLSGAQRFHKVLTQALCASPDILLLDEPTNHLDLSNRRELLNMLNRYTNTLIVSSHDPELLRLIDTIWNISDGHIEVFSGNYDDYQREISIKRAGLEARLSALEKEKKQAHKNLMQEQKRAANSRRHGEISKIRGKWAPIVAGGKKRQAQVTAGRKNSLINSKRDDINRQISELGVREVLAPSFTLPSGSARGNVLFVSDGAAGYSDKIILKDINLSLNAGEKIAVVGDNASGKSTLLKAVMDSSLRVGGVWQTPRLNNCAYLDQHYNNIRVAAKASAGVSALDVISSISPGWTHAEIRRHLNAFLFRKNEEVSADINTLSGGERARLSLAAIACRVPDILMLDEITNNIDLQTRLYTEDILKVYPGAMIIISHDMDFLESVGIDYILRVEDGTLKRGNLI